MFFFLPFFSPLLEGQKSSLGKELMSHLITCAAHNRPRLAKYCIEIPIVDAAGKILRREWRCLPDNECNSQNQPNRTIPPAGEKQFSVQAPTPSGEGATEAMRSYGAAAGGGRYYDLSKTTGGIVSSTNQNQRLCFICGLDDHDRYVCKNVFCRSCRAPVDMTKQHQCSQYRAHQSSGVSPFVALQEFTETPCDPKTGMVIQPRKASNEAADVESNPELPPVRSNQDGPLAGVRCTLCHQYGHFDCVKLDPPKRFLASCSSCGQKGHHGFKCPYRARQDTFWNTQELLLNQKNQQSQRGNMGGSNNSGWEQRDAGRSHQRDSGRRDYDDYNQQQWNSRKRREPQHYLDDFEDDGYSTEEELSDRGNYRRNQTGHHGRRHRVENDGEHWNDDRGHHHQRYNSHSGGSGGKTQSRPFPSYHNHNNHYADTRRRQDDYWQAPPGRR